MPAPILSELLSIPPQSLVVADVGAAFFGERPPYQPLHDAGLCRLFAFEPDESRLAGLREHVGPAATILPFAVADGRKATLHVCPGGMTSLLEPDARSLALFNLLPEIGKVERTVAVSTRRLDDVDEVPAVDFLKIDAQGSELRVFQNARKKLRTCVAIQTEISFVALYKGQPPFGDIDRELRSQGFMPHCFTSVKRWPIAPIQRDNDPKKPFNQLLEADIVYVRDIVNMPLLSNDQLKKIALIVGHCYGSIDLAIRCMLELQRRSVVPAGAAEKYMEEVNRKTRAPGSG